MKGTEFAGGEASANSSARVRAIGLNRQQWPRLVLVGAVVLHVFMFLSLFFGYLDPFFDNSDLQPQGVDFFSIYQGGLYALQNHSIYDWAVAEGVPYAAPYRYLPVFAYTAGVALTVIPPWPAYWLWVTLIEVMLAANAWLTYRMAGDRTWGTVAAAMWFAFTPLYLELYMGQWSFPMATLMLLTAWGLLAGSEARAGGPWLVSLLIKANSAVLGALLLRAGYVRAIVFAGVVVVALNAPYFVARPDDFEWFYRINLRNLWHHAPRSADSLVSGDQGGTEFLQTLWFAFDPDGTGLPAVVKRAFAVAIVGGSLAVTFLPKKVDIVASFATWLCAYFLAYVAVWEHHYVMMLPALALLVALRPQYRELTLFVFVFVALPTPYFLIQHAVSEGRPNYFGSVQAYWPAWAASLHHSTKALPTLALWGTIVWTEMARFIEERRSTMATNAAPNVAA